MKFRSSVIIIFLVNFPTFLTAMEFLAPIVKEDIRYAIEKDDIDILHRLITQNPDLVDIKDVNGKTFLYRAILARSLNSTRLLLEHGAPINFKDKDFIEAADKNVQELLNEFYHLRKAKLMFFIGLHKRTGQNSNIRGLSADCARHILSYLKPKDFSEIPSTPFNESTSSVGSDDSETSDGSETQIDMENTDQCFNLNCKPYYIKKSIKDCVCSHNFVVKLGIGCMISTCVLLTASCGVLGYVFALLSRH